MGLVTELLHSDTDPEEIFLEDFWNICIQVYDETLIDPAR